MLIDVNKVANDTFSTRPAYRGRSSKLSPVDRSIRFDSIRFDQTIERPGRRGRHGGDYSKANGFLVRRAETASRLHKSAPQIFAATRISCAVDLSRPFNGSETRHERTLGTSRRLRGLLLFPERKSPGIVIAFYRGRTRRMMNAGVEFGLSARTARRIASSRTDLARINFPEQFAERETSRDPYGRSMRGTRGILVYSI